MEEDELLLSRTKWDSLKDYVERIELLFCVKVSTALGDNEASPANASSSVRVFLSVAGNLQPMLPEAKSYIDSVTASGSDKQVCWEQQSPHSINILSDHIDTIERQSQAVLSVLDRERVICVWGTHHNVTQAKSLMEQILQENQSGLLQVKTVCADQNVTGDHSELLQVPTLTLSPSVESNPDSCYDSDTSSIASRRSSACNKPDIDWHDDVTRKVSDTLASELAECDLNNPDLSKVVPRAIGGLEHLNYEVMVERYLKLGFSETQLQAALHKLGKSASENNVLQELLDLQQHGVTGSADKHVPTQKESSEGLSDPSLIRSEVELERGLRPIVIDGSNVAMSHGNREVFSCRGIELAVNWFRERDHEDVTVFVPQWRKEASRIDAPITDQEILTELEKERVLVFTPARRVNGKRVVCYDDRYIVKLASENGGIVVSNDNYRDLINESPEFKKVIEQRLLMYTFVNDRFMPPDDPLGRHGPSLDDFLQKEPRPRNCPYSNRCTFGNKCKYYHPERGQQPHKMVSEKLAESAKIKMKKRQLAHTTSAGGGPSKENVIQKKPLSKTLSMPGQKAPLSRTRSVQPQLSAKSLFTRDLSPSDKSVNTQRQLPEKDKSVTDSTQRKMGLKDDIRSTSQNYGFLSSAAGLESGNLQKRDCLTPPSLLSVGHESLRQIHSDPAKLQGNERKGGGHLALAKKLSDEGLGAKPQPISAARMEDTVQHPYSGPQFVSQRNPAQANYFPELEQSHAKLNRQFSLQGANDPRLEPYLSTGFAGDSIQNPARATNHLQNTSEVGHPFQQVGMDGYHWSNRPPHETHAPVSRMASAPVSIQTGSRTAILNAPPPVMIRQNSSSDPQINMVQVSNQGQFAGRWDNRGHPNQIILPLHPGENSNADISHDGTRRPPHAKVAFHPATPQQVPSNMMQVFGNRNLRTSHQIQPEFNMGVPAMPPSGVDQQYRVPSEIQHYSQQVPMMMSSDGNGQFMNPTGSAQIQDSTLYCQPYPLQYESQTQASALLQDEPPNPRAEIFNKLCAIFPKENVQRVMAEHPNVNDPQKLCTFLVTL